jgi:protein-tyrosine-phosphatase/DNA-binding transcriptional ArsR family regulator
VQLAAHPLRWQLLTELAGGDQRVRELVASVGQPQNLVSYHLRLLREGGLVAARRSSADARDSYYHLDLDRCGRGLYAAGSALHPALHPDAGCTRPAAEKQRPSGISVLFACTGNSARSPIAEALLRHRAEDVDVVSAGSHPKRQLHPEAVRVLREKYGIDVGLQRPRHLETLAGRHFDYVVTLCDKVREVCPEFGEHSHRMHWSIPDPAVAGDAGQADYGAFLRTATDIDNRIRHLLSALATEEALP